MTLLSGVESEDSMGDKEARPLHMPRRATFTTCYTRVNRVGGWEIVLVLLTELDFVVHSKGFALIIALSSLGQRCTQSYRAFIHYRQSPAASVILRQRPHAQENIDVHGGGSGGGSSGGSLRLITLIEDVHVRTCLSV